MMWRRVTVKRPGGVVHFLCQQDGQFTWYCGSCLRGKLICPEVGDHCNVCGAVVAESLHIARHLMVPGVRRNAPMA
jgi:hypothetical protein